MGVYAAGNTYGIPEDLIYSFPVQIKVSPSNRPVNMTNTCTKPDSSNVKKCKEMHNVPLVRCDQGDSYSAVN